MARGPPRPPPPLSTPWTRDSLAAAAASLAASHPVLAAQVAAVPLEAVEARLLPSARGTDAHFSTLARSIVAQQISGAAAKTIAGRLVAAVGGALTPGAVVAAPLTALRGAGVSERKTSYLLSLASAFTDGHLAGDTLDALADAGDAAALAAALTRVRGVGAWTADMHAIFHVGLPDVLPVGDLSVARAVRAAFGALPSAGGAELRALTQGWAPHRSLASFYLWRLPAQAAAGGKKKKME